MMKEPPLESGSASHQPEQNHQSTKRLSLKQLQQCFAERVCGQKRTVEIDAQRLCLGCGSGVRHRR